MRKQADECIHRVEARPIPEHIEQSLYVPQMTARLRAGTFFAEDLRYEDFEWAVLHVAHLVTKDRYVGTSMFDGAFQGGLGVWSSAQLARE